ncbi:MAG: hypothetical protein ABI678_02915 [Kofleriaceae bacterium]
MAAAVFALMAGCATDATDGALQEAGAVITSQGAGGVTGSITRDGVTLRFETQTGTGNGTVGAVARVLDEHDRMIAVGFFGHDMPPAWVAALPDVGSADPARLALAQASDDLAALAVPDAHRRALELTAQSVLPILDLEARMDTDPDANIAAMEALDPELQVAIGDYYTALATEPQVRRVYTLGKTTTVAETPVAFAGACNGYDVYKQQNTMLGFTAFRFHQWRNWCWDTGSHRMTSAGDRGSYPSNVNSAFKFDYWWVNQDYWTSYPYQHVYNTQGQFQNCVLKYGCIGTYYPWVKAWADGWGSWTYQKGG